MFCYYHIIRENFPFLILLENCIAIFNDQFCISNYSKEKKKSFFTSMKNEEADELSKALLGGVGLSVDLTENRPKTTEGFRRSPSTKNSNKKNKEEVRQSRNK